MRLGEITYVCRPCIDAEALDNEMPVLEISATVPQVDDDDDAGDDRPMPLLEVSVPSHESGDRDPYADLVDPYADDTVVDMHTTHDEIDDFDTSAVPVIDSTTLSADDRSDGDTTFTGMEFDITDVIDVVEPIQEDSFNAALS
ncbi:uncharacterized protein LOC127871225 [Dreissena polymorpha]|uniref:uncharacterized protein LOC127871225 n=1 Tax=Dreissena polymorpha TaxID=45954 RepID=UPI002264F3C2|nr:uncharacterized protein LOC127871225 [Dreissena polymorpha]